MNDGKTPLYQWAQRNARIDNEYIREAIAELLGTALLCFMVVGAGLQSVVNPDSHAVPVFGTVFGLMIAILVFGGISGAHINPAVSLGLAVAGHLKWVKLPLYIVVQLLGGLLGSLLCYGLYKEHLIYTVAGGPLALNGSTLQEWDETYNGGGIFGGFSPPGTGTYLGAGIATEIVLTAILLMSVMAVIDEKNMEVPKFMVAWYLCITVSALAMCHGVTTGTLLNPARDLSPRLAAYLLGWKKETCFQNVNFSGGVQEWWCVGVFGPPIGSTIGVFLYIFLVGSHLPSDDKTVSSSARAGEESLGKADGDWRQTAFIPRTTSQPAPVQAQTFLNDPQNNASYNNRPVNGPAPGIPGSYGGYNNSNGGFNNGGYMPENPRQRQPY